MMKKINTLSLNVINIHYRWTKLFGIVGENNMNSFIWIDLGTSGVKLLLVESNGHILAEQCENYPIFHPFPECNK